MEDQQQDNTPDQLARRAARDYMRRYRATHRTQVNENARRSQREYRRQNGEKVRQWDRARYRRDRKKRLAAMQAYDRATRAKNPEKFCERNRDKMLKWRAKQAAARALEARARFESVPEMKRTVNDWLPTQTTYKNLSEVARAASISPAVLRKCSDGTYEPIPRIRRAIFNLTGGELPRYAEKRSRSMKTAWAKPGAAEPWRTRIKAGWRRTNEERRAIDAYIVELAGRALPLGEVVREVKARWNVSASSIYRRIRLLKLNASSQHKQNATLLSFFHAMRRNFRDRATLPDVLEISEWHASELKRNAAGVFREILPLWPNLKAELTPNDIEHIVRTDRRSGRYLVPLAARVLRTRARGIKPTRPSKHPGRPPAKTSLFIEAKRLREEEKLSWSKLAKRLTPKEFQQDPRNAAEAIRIGVRRLRT